MNPFNILAIDPGASGGIVHYTHQGVKPIAMPESDDDSREFIETFHKESMACEVAPVAYIELVGGFVGGNPAPGSAMFNFGDGYGYLRGLIDGYRIKRVMVRPQVWQKGIPGATSGEKKERKNSFKEHAARLFPHLRVTLKTADALCIAEWARRQEMINAPDVETRDAAEALAWCRVMGYDIPKRDSAEWYSMIAYYKSIDASE